MEPLLQQERSDSGGRLDRVDGLGVARRHRHALAPGEAVELDDDRAAELGSTSRSPRRRRRNGRTRGRGCRASRRARGRTTSTIRAGRASAVGPKHGDAATGALVGHPVDQRRFGPGDHEIGVVGDGIAELRIDPHVVPVVPAGPRDRLLAADPIRSTSTRIRRGRLRTRAWPGRHRRHRVLPGVAGVAVAVVVVRRVRPPPASSRRATGTPGCRRRCARASRRRVSRAAMRSPSWPMSTPKWHACVIGGHVMRTWTSVAPASRTSFTSGPGRGAAHERVVDHHHPLALEVLARAH